LTFRMLGYTFDPNTKELQQTGLVQYESHPGGALVYVDDMELRRTPTKSTVLPGKHTFSMKLDHTNSQNGLTFTRNMHKNSLTLVALMPIRTRRSN
jgi:hypothetical protein